MRSHSTPAQYAPFIPCHSPQPLARALARPGARPCPAPFLLAKRYQTDINCQRYPYTNQKNTTYTTYTTYTTPASSLWETAFLCISRISLDIMWHQYMGHSQATGESGVSGVGGVTGVYVIFMCQYMSLTGRWGKWRKWCRWCHWCGKWRKWSNWCVCEVKFSGCH